MLNRLLTLLLLVCLSVCGCAKNAEGDPAPGPHDGLQTTAALLLSPANPAASPKDEDASIMLARDDNFYVSWLSNRDGNDELYVMRSPNGSTWSTPYRVTNNADSDWYPTMIQTPNGRFHMVWMRQTATTRNVWYNSSADGITWSGASEMPVTTGVSDDFVPYLIEISGVLHVYFDSATRSADATRGLFLVQSTAFLPNGAVSTWSAPSPLNINSSTESDQFPYVQYRPAGGLMLTWIRHAGSATLLNGYLDPTTDVNWAVSTDGVNWTYWGAIMPEDGSVDTIPSLYVAFDGTEVLTWMRGIGAAPNVIEIAVTPVSGWPGAATNITAANGVTGWSPRVVRTLKANTYIRVWVGSADLRLYYQVFTR